MQWVCCVFVRVFFGGGGGEEWEGMMLFSMPFPVFFSVLFEIRTSELW